MTLADLRTRVLERIQENASSPGRWPAARIDKYLNEGVRLMAVRSGALIGTATIEAVAEQLRYELPRDCVQVMGIVRRSPREVVDPVGVRELDATHPAWQTINGSRFEWYFVFGVQDIFLVPALSSGGEVYDLTYRQDPGDSSLVDDTDEPPLPRRYHEALINYAISRALMINANEKRLETATNAMQMFATAIGGLRKATHRPPDRVHRMREGDSAGGWVH